MGVSVCMLYVVCCPSPVRMGVSGGFSRCRLLVVGGSSSSGIGVSGDLAAVVGGPSPLSVRVILRAVTGEFQRRGVVFAEGRWLSIANSSLVASIAELGERRR